MVHLRPQQRRATSQLVASAMPSRGPKSGRKCYVSPTFLGVPNKGEQNQDCLLQPCLLGGPKVGGSSMSPLHSRGSPTKWNKIRIGCLSHAFSGAKSGRKCYVNPAFSGVPNKGEQNQNCLPQPCLLGGPKESGSSMSPLHSRGSPTKWNKITTGCLSHAFSGAQMWAEVLCHPCILGGPQ